MYQYGIYIQQRERERERERETRHWYQEFPCTCIHARFHIVKTYTYTTYTYTSRMQQHRKSMMPTICENKEFKVALRPVKTELVKVCWRMGWHLGTSGGPLPLLLKITSNARSSVLFVSVCKVTPHVHMFHQACVRRQNDAFARMLDGTYEIWCAHIKDTKSHRQNRCF